MRDESKHKKRPSGCNKPGGFFVLGWGWLLEKVVSSLHQCVRNSISKVTLYEEIIYFCLAVLCLPDGGGTAERDPGADTRPGELYQYYGR